MYMNWYKQQIKIAMPRKSRITQDIIDRVVHLRKNTNMTIKQIGEEVGLSYVPVSKILKDNNLIRPRVTKEQMEEIAYFYNDGTEVKELAEAYDLTVTTILTILKKEKVYDPERSRRTQMVSVDEKNKDIILEKYRQGYGVSELNREFGESVQAIRNLLKDNNVHIRTHKEQSLTDRSRQQASEKFKNMWQDEDKREHLINLTRERTQTDEYKEKRRQNMLEQMENDPSIKERLREQSKTLWEIPGMREHLIQKSREARNTPEYKEQLSKRSLENWKQVGGLEGRLLSYPTREQSINFLNGFVGNLWETNPSQAGAIRNKYMEIINAHIFPSEI